MKNYRRALLILALSSLPVWARDSGELKGQGYAFFGPGASTPGGTATVHFGLGGEGLIYKGLGLGAELGYLTPWESFSSGIGVFSLDGSYHFSPNKKADPFVTVGYTLIFRAGTANLFNVGAGVNYWIRRHYGLRLEFRDQAHPTGVTEHFFEFRIGLAFR